MVAVLFVCLGNICRSPAAEGLLKYLNEREKGVKNLQVASCGMGSWHVGQLPHDEMRQAAEERGVTLSSRAQQFDQAFLENFDYILAVDHNILNELYQHADTPDLKAKIHLITEFSQTYFREEIPDPFYRGRAAFDQVLDMLEDSCLGLIQHLKNTP